MEYDKHVFMQNVELLMQEKGIKISELESMCQLSQGYFSRFKASDKNAAPNINLIINLCTFFDVSINTLLFVDCNNVFNHEKEIINFIDKLSDQTYSDIIHWKSFSISSDYDTILNSCLVSLFEQDEVNKIFRYESKFDSCRYIGDNGYIFAYKNNKCEYYVLCKVEDSQYSIIESEDPILELYFIKDNKVHKIVDTNVKNNYIFEKLQSLYMCILKEQNATRLDVETFEAISKY